MRIFLLIFLVSCGTDEGSNNSQQLDQTIPEREEIEESNILQTTSQDYPKCFEKDEINKIYTICKLDELTTETKWIIENNDGIITGDHYITENHNGESLDIYSQTYYDNVELPHQLNITYEYLYDSNQNIIDTAPKTAERFYVNSVVNGKEEIEYCKSPKMQIYQYKKYDSNNGKGWRMVMPSGKSCDELW